MVLIQDVGAYEIRYVAPGGMFGFENVVHVNAADAIGDNQVPTDAQVCNETIRVIQMHQGQSRGGIVDQHLLSEGIIRQHIVANARSGIGNAAVLQNLGQMQEQLNEMQQTQTQMQQTQTQMQQTQTQMQNQMQQMQNQMQQMQQTQVQMQGQITQNQVQIEAQFAQVHAQLQPLPGLVTQLIESVSVIEARSKANGARLFNSQIALSEDALYVPVVKYTAGHPFPLDELVHLPRVQFTHIVYPVNSEPPANLMPRNSRQLEGWRSADNVDMMRRRLLSIYWFYNDGRLALDDDADENVCRRLFKAVDNFLRIP